MTERPIIFSAPMVRALLDGRKTQTRRVMKPQLIYGTVAGLFNSWYLPLSEGGGTLYPNGKEKILGTCPYGQPGDRLWVRETFHGHHWDEPRAVYKADGECQRVRTQIESYEVARWTPSIHMPRWASRITLEITAVRVERLQDISEADALAEGIARHADGSGFHTEDGRHYSADPRESFASLWESINGPGSWDSNPWVWVVEFQRIDP